MSKITRKTAVVFGASAGFQQIAEFGSFAASTPAFSTDPAVIQSLSQWLEGWFGAVVGNNSPAIEDMNAFCYVAAYQLAYVMQAGIPEYDSGTTYYTGSFVNSSGNIYVSLQDNNVGHPISNTTYWALYMNSAQNILLNSAFDFWGRGTLIVVTNGQHLYGPDRWYINNVLGGAGVITASQVTGVLNGSLYGAQIKITTAPTSSIANGCELYQVLENGDSIQFYGKSASFSANVKALGNVNQIGLQFYYATSEVALTTAIGSEVLVSVNSSTFSFGAVLNQALGTSQTTSGVVGVRIRITGVSTGNTWDLNNGFVVEQCMMNIGNVPGTFKRVGSNIGEEFNLCSRFYESFNPSTSEALASGYVLSGSSCGFYLPYSTEKRISLPTVTTLNGGSGGFSISLTGGNVTPGALSSGGFPPGKRGTGLLATGSFSGAGNGAILEGNSGGGGIFVDAEIY